eukprot:g3403.t1
MADGDGDDDDDMVIGSDMDPDCSDDGEYSSDDSEIDDDDFYEPSKSSISSHIGRTKASRSGLKYVIRSPDEFVEWMESVAEELAEEYDLDIFQTRKLLIWSNYNAESLRNPLKYELESTLRKAGLSLDDDDEDDVNEDVEITCPVCWEDVKISDTDALGCGHRFCRSCWKRHITESVLCGSSSKGYGLDRRLAVGLTCMQSNCKVRIPIDKLEEYGGKTFTSKRNIWYAEDVAVKVAHMRMCPAIDCHNIIDFVCSEEYMLKNESETGELECTCGYWFCFLCSREAHAPCSCEEVNDWRALSSEDAAIERLKAKCKMCPGCGAGCYINDKKACNHMVCPCGHEWCWMCERPWSEHGNSYYNCANYAKDSASKVKKKNLERDKKLADIQRLQHYEERVSRMAAGSKGKAAAALRKQVDIIRQQLQAKCGHTDTELKFLNDAYDAVIRMKQMLKWSTVYLFFRPKSDDDLERSLFENQQGRLEFMCDMLHEKLDPHAPEDIAKFKSFLSTDKKSQNLFQEWKAFILGLTARIEKFGSDITGAALKGTTIIDEKARVKIQAKLAKERIKLVDWQYLEKGKWITFNAGVASQLELCKLMRNKRCTVTDGANVLHFDMIKRTERLSSAGATAIERPIRRQVKASLARNVWTCPKCQYQTPKDLNACSNCGSVKGH